MALYKSPDREFPVPGNNLSFNKKKRPTLLPISLREKKKGSDAEGESNSEKHYNEETISENL